MYQLKEVKKLSMYINLNIEETKIWYMKTSTVPVVMGSLSITKKIFETYINQILGHIRSEELQKIALLRSPHILRRTLSII